MDTKLYPNLDPQLKDVYDKVMGFKPNLASKANPAPSPTPTIAYAPQSTPKPTPSPTPLIATNSEAKKNNSVSGVIVIAVAVIFFLVYALFWIKLFNIQLPFSLPF